MESKTSMLDYLESLNNDSSVMNGLYIEKTIRSGDYIFTQGNPVNYFYVIKAGLVKCFVNEDTDKDYILAFRSRGETLGEAELIRNATSCCYVQAIEDTVVYRISNHAFFQRTETDEFFNKLVLKGLAAKLQKLAIRSATQHLQTSKDLLQNAIDIFKSQHLSLTKQDLADYLGITVRSLNRTLKEVDENPFALHRKI